MLKTFIKIFLKFLLPKSLWEKRAPFFEFLYQKFEDLMILSYGIFYKLKQPKYFFYPYRHVVAINYLNIVIGLLQDEKIEYFITAGALLGGLRQGAIAGGAHDLDIGIKESSKDTEYKLNKVLEKLKKKNFDIKKLKGGDSWHARRWYLVDFALFRKIKINNNYHWTHNNSLDQTWSTQEKSLDELKKIKFYDFYIFAPSNPEKLVETIYGSDWIQPHKKKQFKFF